MYIYSEIANNERINPMRKLLLTTAAVAAAIGLAGCSKKPPPESAPETPNTLLDSRDGQTYRTVKIGEQTWMAENMNYKTKRGSWLYDGLCDKDSLSYYTTYGKAFDKRYGRVYDWKRAKKICPAGWKLPDTADWNMLVKTVGGKMAAKTLKSKNAWNKWEEGSDTNGTDDFGFSALPGGGCVPNGYFEIMDDFGRWWTATKYTNVPEAGKWRRMNNFAYFRGMNEFDNITKPTGGGYSYRDEITERIDEMSIGYSVRCVQKNRTERRGSIRKRVRTTAAAAAANRLEKHLPIIYDTLTDERDGKTYKTIAIGGKRWMAENLNYETDSSWCYNDTLSYCETYGRLYAWNAAKTACPAGYHLPSREEWDNLAGSAGGLFFPLGGDFHHWDLAGKRLKARTGWNTYKRKSGNGKDNCGFSALPGGSRHRDAGDFGYAGAIGFWWTSTEFFVDSHALYRYMDNYHVNMDEHYGRKDHGYSVRCVADRP